MNHQTSHTDPECHAVIKRTLGILDDLDRLWGSARLGLALSQAFFEQSPMTTDELAQECDASRETVRRWLKPLINIGRVRVLKEGRNIRYKARADWARRTCELIMTANGNG